MLDKDQSAQHAMATAIEQYTSLDQYWSQHCAPYNERVAYTNMGASITYAELDRYARDFAAFLQHSPQLKAGDRIAIQLPNILQYPVIVQAAWRAGLVVVNTNPLYSVTDTIRQFNDADVKAVVILANNAASLETVLPGTGVKLVIVTQLADLHPLPKRLYINLKARFIRRIVPKYCRRKVVHFRRALFQGARLPVRINTRSLDDLAMIQYTVGTTGRPKGAMLSHRNLVANLHQLQSRFDHVLVEGEEIAMAPLPLDHIYSFTFHCLFLPAYGTHVVLITNAADTDGFVNEMARWPFTIFSGLNSLFVTLCQYAPFRQLDLSTLRLTFSGGMALTRSADEYWQKVTGCQILQGYGLTESSPVVAASDPAEYQDGTVGKPLPMTDVRIIGENGELLCSGEYGEIQIKGPQVMQGYWRGTAQDLQPQGWFATGDIGRVTEQGLLKIVERQCDVINVAGFPVYPNELENIISSHADIQECAVIGLPDDEEGTVLKLFVVASNHQLSVKLIRDYCRERLTYYKVPRLVEFREHLPQSSVGKTLRRQLLEEELARIKKLRRHF